ncbi:hypothetical protein Trydic_g8817, partial [Trypoxylus dichotomus]
DAGVQSLIEAYDLPTFHFRNRRFRSHSDFSLMFSSFPIKALAWFPYERPSSRQQRKVGNGTGVPQGDSMSSLLFNLIIKKIKDSVKFDYVMVCGRCGVSHR